MRNVLASVLAVVFVAAHAVPAAPGAPAAQARTVTIGFTASQTGSLNVESMRQINGLNLWIEHVNAGGGVRLPDSTVVKFAAKFYDDESNKDRVQSLYTRLLNDDRAEFLISPYSSGLADAAAVIAEQYGKIMITTGAASDSTYQKGFSLVYQAYTPASRYLTGALDLLAKLDPSAKKVSFIHETDKFSTDVVNAARTYGAGMGFQTVLFEGYDSRTTDFAPFINKIPPGTDAVMGGGHFADGSTFARQLWEKRVNAKFIGLLVAPPEPQFAELGDAALGVVGPSQWEPQARYAAESARAGNLAWYGISLADFVRMYTARFKEEPSYHSAGGYAAGLILQYAIEKAGTLDAQKIKAVLDAMDVLTFYGHVKFETSPKMHGLQIGHEMVYIQWQKDARGKLAKQVVWPPEGKSAETLYPVRR